MIFTLLSIEFVKLKRSIIPVVLLAAAILAALSAVLFVKYEIRVLNWNTVYKTSLGYYNQIIFLLLAFFTGIVFIGEFHEKFCNTIFTYPVSRFLLYISKLIFIFIFTFILYIMNSIFTFVFGVICLKELPTFELILSVFKADSILVVVAFSIVPFTALICLVFKELSAGAIAGMSYVVSNIVFINSRFKRLVLTCIPAEITDKILSNNFSALNLSNISLLVSIVFAAGLTASIVFYLRSDF